MVFRWKEDHTPLVLDLLRKNECLWNTRNIGYRNKLDRESALWAVVEGLNLPVTPEDIKLKIKTIRTRYSCELAKVLRSENSGAGPEGIYVPKLCWYKQADAFLRAVSVPRSSGCNINATKANHPEEYVSVEIQGQELYGDNGQTLKINTADNNDDDDVGEFGYREIIDDKQSVEREIHKHSMLGLETNVQGMGMKRSSLDDVTCNNTKIRKLSNLDLCQDAENEFDLFCRSLAVQLKNMPLQRALVCQQQLQQVMTNERLFQLSNPHSNVQQCSKYTLVQSPSVGINTPHHGHIEEDAPRYNVS